MLDRLIPEIDKVLRTLFAPAATLRAMPGEDLPEADLSDAARRHAAALMRINHCGEICAQALYQGQAITSRQPAVKAALAKAAQEETEHLNWTERRIAELGGRKSLLNPTLVRRLARLGPDCWQDSVTNWNTRLFRRKRKRQVEQHLESHKTQLSPDDQKSWVLLERNEGG